MRREVWSSGRVAGDLAPAGSILTEVAQARFPRRTSDGAASLRLTRGEELDVVTAQIQQFLVHTEEERYVIYQDFVRCIVSRTSPLLADYAKSQGVDLAECLALIQPPQQWPGRLDAPRSPISRYAMLRDETKGYSFAGSREDDVFRHRFRRGGVVMRLPSDADGRFGLRISGNALEACFDLGSVRLVVGGEGTGWMRLPVGIPETLLCACVGRTVDWLVGHPLFEGRDLTVKRLGYASAVASAPVISFRDTIADLDLRRS